MAVFAIERIDGGFGVAERCFVDVHVGFDGIHVVARREEVDDWLIDDIGVWYIGYPEMAIQERQLGFELSYSTAELGDFDFGVHDGGPFLM